MRYELRAPLEKKALEFDTGRKWHYTNRGGNEKRREREKERGMEKSGGKARPERTYSCFGIMGS